MATVILNVALRVGINSSTPGPNDHHFADDIFKCIFLNESFRILIKISLKVVQDNPFDNKAILFQVMVWRLFGAKPLPEPMLTRFADTSMRQSGEMSQT